MPVTMDEQDYDGLLLWAVSGAEAAGARAQLEQLQKRVDQANGIKRYQLLVRYDVVPSTPATINPSGPAGYSLVVRQRAPITREDVLRVLSDKPTAPALIYVTRDMAGIVGWYELEAFMF